MKRYGEYIKNLSGEAEYLSFRPSPLPPELTIDEEMTEKLVKANKALSALDVASELIPDTSLFISMYVRKEALVSSQIEGTQCTLDDVLDPNIETNSNLDVSDVINYVNAVQYAVERRSSLPLCNRMIREIHGEMLRNVRGQEKNPGGFRTSQNWIGPANCSLREARYIPPNVDDMKKAMYDLEDYMNTSIEYDPLIRNALIHYQFETIHPFLDGNGRVGRIMILLYLLEQRNLKKPVIYISYFLKKNQIEYYDRISEVRRTGNYEQWIKFFLDAVYNAAVDSYETIIKMNELHSANLDKLPVTNRASDNVRKVFTYLAEHPIIEIRKTADILGLSYNTVSTAVKKLLEIGILKETSNAARNRVFVYEDYLSLLRKDT